MMEIQLQEPEMHRIPNEENFREWENFAEQEMRALGVLEEAETWLSEQTLPSYWRYGKYAYAYHEAPLWLFDTKTETREFFYG